MGRSPDSQLPLPQLLGESQAIAGVRKQFSDEVTEELLD